MAVSHLSIGGRVFVGKDGCVRLTNRQAEPADGEVSVGALSAVAFLAAGEVPRISVELLGGSLDIKGEGELFTMIAGRRYRLVPEQDQ